MLSIIKTAQPQPPPRHTHTQNDSLPPPTATLLPPRHPRLVADQRIDEAGLLAKITHPDGVVLLVTDDSAPDTDADASTPLSCCEVLRKPDGRTAYFGLFAVDPESQAGGVGRRVLGYAEEFARREWGVGRIEMWVIWVREELIRWYERRGYRRTGERREFPYKELVGGEALRDDLYFVVLEKEL
ncbi:acetyltransferase [Colletotrichum camelliae]|nr:acetyltransferase [Colletotrichum camelliae]